MRSADARTASAPVSRTDVVRAGAKLLSRGGAGNPDVVLVTTAGGPVVVKDFAPRGRLVRDTLGRWLTRREQRAYRRLAGLAIVPRWLGPVDAHAFALEYRPGEPLSRSLRGRLPDDFVSRLEAGVRAMHARGVVHLDLRHRSNVLATADGRPVVLDLASAVCVDPRSAFGRLVVATLGAVDRRALRKWRERLAPAAGAQPPSLAVGEGAGSSVTASAGSRGASRPM